MFCHGCTQSLQPHFTALFILLPSKRLALCAVRRCRRSANRQYMKKDAGDGKYMFTAVKKVPVRRSVPGRDD